MADYRSMVKDPDFRCQYDFTPKPDAQFEAALAGAPQPRMSIPVSTAPLNIGPWLQPLHKP